MPKSPKVMGVLTFDTDDDLFLKTPLSDEPFVRKTICFFGKSDEDVRKKALAFVLYIEICAFRNKEDYARDYKETLYDLRVAIEKGCDIFIGGNRTASFQSDDNPVIL